MELLLVLGVPFAGGILLGFWGHRNFAPELNSGMSLLTLLAAASLTARIIADGPILVWNETFFVDSFNVFLVALTAFVAFTTSLFSRPYMRIELNQGRLSPNRLRLYHSMYQMFTFTMLLALLTNNVGILWVAMENGLFFAATSATYGMPMVVELGIALDVLVGTFIFGVFFFHIRETFESLDIHHLEKLKER